MNKIQIIDDNNIPTIYVKSICYKSPVPIDTYDDEIGLLTNYINRAIDKFGYFVLVIDNEMVKLAHFDRNFFQRMCEEIDKNPHIITKLIECRIINSSNTLKMIFEIFERCFSRPLRKKIRIL